MTTPERPSLADTLARIDAALAERAPGSGPTIAEVNTAREQLGLPRLEPVPPEPVVRDGNTFTVTQPGVYLLSNAPAPEPGWLARALRRLGVW